MDPLSQLRALHLPPEPGWWPLAPGWWLISIATVLLMVSGFIALYRHRKKNTWRRAALSELNRIKQHSNSTAQDSIIRCALLLKRVALAIDSRSHVAALGGQQWLAYLDQVTQTDQYTKGAGQLLTQAQYQPADVLDASVTDSELNALYALVERTVKRSPYLRRKANRV
ncbi:MAG: DUF4381 domain-containing protein [Gammaproteobacteria bacterium]|nr:DUF4381 domain-containing protein [Gammaproteobacteria bacterium]